MATHLDYDDFLEQVEELEFIKNEEEADAAVRAVLGLLAGRMEETDARFMTERLPEPLSYEGLRGRGYGEADITVGEYIAEIADQFNLDEDQAQELVETVLTVAKEAIGEDMVTTLERRLPTDWADVLENA